jgi:serine/threonine protein kinase
MSNSKSNNWLENSITEEHIRYYEYSDFKDIKQIGKGSFGSVFCATWKITNRSFALKSFNNDKQTLEQVVKEVILNIL